MILSFVPTLFSVASQKMINKVPCDLGLLRLQWLLIG